MSYTIGHFDEFERTGNWALVRRGLGVSAFGINAVDIPAGERIPEHDETGRDQEEVFIVLTGSPSMLIDGQEQPAPAGACVRVDPEHSRTVVNNGSETARVLIVSAPRTSGYEPMSWG
jgi:mannose-6-phosphate isomerase-like protein (cupin superfamily)